MVRPILYISGPYTGNEFHSTEENIKTARQYAITAWEKGWAALVPHLNTAGFEKITGYLKHEDWVDGYLTILSRLDPKRDGILMLPRWMESKGSVMEMKHALWHGIRIFYSIDFDMGVPDAETFKLKE